MNIYTTCSGVYFPTRENLRNCINELMEDYTRFSDNEKVFRVNYVHDKYEFMPDRFIQDAQEAKKENRNVIVFCIWRHNEHEMKVAVNHIVVR